jgi:hypothetical protein
LGKVAPAPVSAAPPLDAASRLWPDCGLSGEQLIETRKSPATISRREKIIS